MSSQPASLPDILTEASKGNITLDFARQHLGQYLNSVTATRHDFQASLSTLDPQVLEQCQAQSAEVERLLLLLMELAEEALGHLEGGSPGPLFSLGEQIRAVTHDLNVAMGAYREASLIAMGPTSLAGVNLILRTVNATLQSAGGMSNASRLIELVEQEQSRVDYALAQPACPPELQEALRHFAGALTLLRSAVESGQMTALESSLDRLLDCSDEVEETLRQIQVRDTLLQGPSRFARINLLLNLGAQALQDGAEPGPFLESCHSLLQNVAMWRAQLGSLVRKLGRSPLVTEHGHKVDQAYEHFASFIAEYSHCVQEREEAALAEIVADLLAGWDEVLSLQKELEQLLETQDKVPCVRCGHYNPNDKRNCQQCGAILPKVAEERTHALNVQAGDGAGGAAPQQDAPQMTENLERLFGAVEAYVKGASALEEYQGVISWMTDLVAQARQTLAGDAPQLSERIAEGGDDDGESEDEADSPVKEAPSGDPVALYLEGLQDIEAGLGFLSQMTEPSETLAETGSTLIWEGTGKLQRAATAMK